MDACFSSCQCQRHIISPSPTPTPLFLKDRAIASCGASPGVRSLWSFSSFHVPLPPHPCAALNAESVYLCPAALSIPPFLLMFSCAARCMFKVKSPPGEAQTSAVELL